MANNDGQKQEGETKVRWCPILKEYCIGERCAMSVELTRIVGGLQKKFRVCVYSAMVIMLTEINQKTQPPMQKIQIPHLLKG